MIQPLNRRRFSAGLALAPWAAGGLLTGCSNIPDSIKIGVAQPLSGPLSALGKDLLNGVQLAVNELNKANFSIEGKRVTLEVMSVDDKADAATGKTVAQQLVDAGVVAVVGHLNSGVSIETAPIYAAAGIAQIAISTNPKFTQLGHETTFRMVANDNLQARAIGSFASSQFGDVRFAALDDGTPYGKGLTDGAVEQLKAEKREVVLRQSFDDKTVTFDELAAKIKSEKVGVIVSTLNDFQAVALIAALAKIDYTNVRLLGGRHGQDHRHGQGGGADPGHFCHLAGAGGQGVCGGPPVPGALPGSVQDSPGLRWALHVRQHLCADSCHAGGQVGQAQGRDGGTAPHQWLRAGHRHHEVG